MRTNFLSLEHLLNLETWQALQDSIALATGLAILTVDYKGKPLTTHSSCRSFCSHVRQDPNLSGYCEKCDSRGGLESVRNARPYIYVCHCKIVDIAIPIIAENQYIGAIMAGQVKLANAKEEAQLEQIIQSPTNQLFQDAQLMEQYKEIPRMSYAELQIRVKLLLDLCNYIVQEAIHKNILIDMYENLTQEKPLVDEFHSPKAIKRLRHELGNALTNAYIESASQELHTCSNPVLQPVFDYIQNNRNTMLPQQKAAALCHISPGYFSRLFIQETGERYCEFFSRQKVEWAKKLLRKTDLPISQISDELGFNEPSYFIKVFRKFEGTSPSSYRKLAEETKPTKE